MIRVNELLPGESGGILSVDLPRPELLGLPRVLADVLMERDRQETLKEQGRFPSTCRDLGLVAPLYAFAILTEEVGEVARELCEYRQGHQSRHQTRGKLRAELVQVAAIVAAWIEGLDATE